MAPQAAMPTFQERRITTAEGEFAIATPNIALREELYHLSTSFRQSSAVARGGSESPKIGGARSVEIA